MELTKQDIKETKGIAILSMLLLHLFCRKGTDVYGTPLIWLSEDTPLIYYLGFLSEICVPMYCMCSGYAHYRLGESGGLTVKRNCRRGLKFLLNYWIILLIFSLVGILVQSTTIPVSIERFLGNFFLYRVSYNGAWWFVPTYIILLCLSYGVYKLVCSLHGVIILGVGSMELLFFALFKTRVQEFLTGNFAVECIGTQVLNLAGVPIFSYIAGMMIARYALISYLKKRKLPDWVLIVALIIASLAVCIIHKAILMPYYAILVFTVANVVNKNAGVKKGLGFLGKHSTNIWLVHMFFYLTLFPGLVQNLKYPFLIFMGLLMICILVSLIINYIYTLIIKMLKIA